MESKLHKSIFEMCPDEVAEFFVQVSFVLRLPESGDECLYCDTYGFKYITDDALSRAREITSREFLLSFDDNHYLDTVRLSCAKISNGLNALRHGHQILFNCVYMNFKLCIYKSLGELTLFQCASTLEL